MSILYKSFLILSFLTVTSLYSLPPAGRVMTPINSSDDNLRDRQIYDKDRDYDRDRGDRKYKDRPRVYNQYYYPYYGGYSGYGPGYAAPGYGYPGYYGAPGYYPYVPGSAFPDDAAADELFDRLSK